MGGALSSQLSYEWLQVFNPAGPSEEPLEMHLKLAFQGIKLQECILWCSSPVGQRIVTCVLTSMSWCAWVLSGYPEVTHACVKETSGQEAKGTQQRHEVSLQLHKASPWLIEVVTTTVAGVRALADVLYKVM